MKLRNDFYFWASITLSAFVLVLIFYIYQSEFGFKEFLDTKTILSVLGTLGGAYFGAAQAGKYSVKAVEKERNKSSEVKR